MDQVTVLGGSGFIGSAVVKKLEQTGAEYSAPGRDEILRGPLGDVIYCIGLTADFRSRPFETVEAHVCHLLRVLRDCEFNSLVYLSSARVYQNQRAPAREEDPIQVNSLDPNDLYNISKIMGESLALASGKKIRVVRLSNVYGDDFTSRNFLPSLVREAISKRKLTVRSAPEAEKDYVGIQDVVEGLLKIAAGAGQSIYNLASGMNVSNRALIQKISELTGCEAVFDPAAPTTTFPVMSIDRIRAEFGFRPRYILDDLSTLVDSYKEHSAGRAAGR
jgi:nucleoside-diphosphate-sugar epimerase